MSGEEHAELRRSPGRRATSGQGELDRADSTLGRDSTVEGLALAGSAQAVPWRPRGRDGALQGGRALRRRPRRRHPAYHACSRCSSRSRPTRFRALGARAPPARAGRHDARRSRASKAVAQRLPAAKGGAEVRLLAGRLRRPRWRPPSAPSGSSGRPRSTDAPATAPAAELALAELLLDRQRTEDAIAQLEHLILTYPESALVPQARRTLDQARGAVPRHEAARVRPARR